MEFHGIIVNQSLKNEDKIKEWEVIGKKGEGDGWILYKIRVDENKLQDLMKEVQESMIDGPWYAHFYNEDGSKVLVVFKSKIVDITDLDEIDRIAQELKIPLEQMDFAPRNFQEETY